MLNIKQEYCEYQLLSFLVGLDKGIKVRSIDYKANTLVTISDILCQFTNH